jgi:hypothetical protein
MLGILERTAPCMLASGKRFRERLEARLGNVEGEHERDDLTVPRADVVDGSGHVRGRSTVRDRCASACAKARTAALQ